MSEFKDKVVIVTGASSGIGAATAVEYAKHRAKLVLGGRNEENLNKTGEQCQQHGLNKDKILLVKGDLMLEDDCNRMVDQAVDKFGQIDILINCAGDAVPGNILECSVADMDAMYNSHVRSAFMMTKRAIPSLIKTKGSIVNISSVAGIRPLSKFAAYAIAKAAVAHMTGIMAQDLGHMGVNVNCIAPSVIKTRIFSRPGGILADRPEKLSEFYEAAGNLGPLGRVGKASEVAETIVYLTSKAASFITGAVLPIDGGHHGTSNHL